jgi:hypothetical protein
MRSRAARTAAIISGRGVRAAKALESKLIPAQQE